MKLSKNGIGFLALILGTIGVSVAEADLAIFVSVLLQIISGVLMFLNQWNREDVYRFIFKK